MSKHRLLNLLIILFIWMFAGGKGVYAAVSSTEVPSFPVTTITPAVQVNFSAPISATQALVSGSTYIQGWPVTNDNSNRLISFINTPEQGITSGSAPYTYITVPYTGKYRLGGILYLYNFNTVASNYLVHVLLYNEPNLHVYISDTPGIAPTNTAQGGSWNINLNSLASIGGAYYYINKGEKIKLQVWADGPQGTTSYIILPGSYLSLDSN